jgi:hypothetical protein
LQYSFAFLRTGPRPWSKMMEDNILFNLCHNRFDHACICVHGSIAAILCAIEAWMHEVIPEGITDGIYEYDSDPELNVHSTVKWAADLLRGLQGHTFAPLMFMNSVGWPYSFKKLKQILDMLDGNADVNLEVAKQRATWRMAEISQWGQSYQEGWKTRHKQIMDDDRGPCDVRIYALGNHQSVGAEVLSVIGMRLKHRYNLIATSALQGDYCGHHGKHRTGYKTVCDGEAEARAIFDRHIDGKASKKHGSASHSLNRMLIEDVAGFDDEVYHYLRQNDASANADILFCWEPVYVCVILARLSKPIFGFIGAPALFYLHRNDHVEFLYRFNEYAEFYFSFLNVI